MHDQDHRRDESASLRDAIRARRRARDWSQRDLAERTGYSRELIVKVEGGAKPVSAGLAEALDRAFDAEGALIDLRARAERQRQRARLGLADHGHDRGETAAQPPDTGALWSVGPDLAPDDRERLVAAARSPRSRDPRIVEALATVLAGQRLAEDSIGSRPLLEPVLSQLAVIMRLVAEARGDMRTGMLDIGSQWVQFAGWLRENTGDLPEADRLFGLALTWATEADEPSMVSTALNLQGHTAYVRADAAPMIGLSRAAQRDRRASPGARALAVQQEARGMALSGEATGREIDQKFDVAQELASRAAARPDDEPPWIYFFSPQYLTLQRGLAHRLSGNYARASALLTAGIESVAPEFRDTEWVARYLLELALTRAHAGDVAEASRLAADVALIAQRTASVRLPADLVRLRDRLARRWPDHPAVVELGEVLAPTERGLPPR